MKVRSWLIIPVLSTGWSCAGEQPWHTQAIDERVRVQVPGELLKLPPPMLELLGMPSEAGQVVWGAEDAEGLYLVIRQTPGRITNRNLYYDGLVKGLIGRAQGSLLARSAFATPGGKGIEVVFKARDPSSGKSVVQSSQHVLVDSCVYSFSFISGNEQDSTGASGRGKPPPVF